MVDPISVAAVGYFLPIFAFLLVFIVIYAILKKTGVLGGSEPVMLFIGLIMASFFVVEITLVEFVEQVSAWFSVLVIAVFFVLLLAAFMPWKDNMKFLTKSDWFSWTLLALVLAIFLVSAYYTFNFAINWDELWEKTGSEWFGFLLLLVVAAVVAWTVKKK